MKFWEDVDPGTLRKRVTFLRQGERLDGFGQTTAGLEPVVTVWGDLYPVRGQERYEVQRIQGSVTHKCYVRWHSLLKDADSNWYLECGGRLYSVESCIDAGNAGRMLEVYCTLHVNTEEVPYGRDGG